MARDGRAANVEAYEAMKKLAPGWTAELGTRKATSPAHCCDVGGNIIFSVPDLVFDYEYSLELCTDHV